MQESEQKTRKKLAFIRNIGSIENMNVGGMDWDV